MTKQEFKEFCHEEFTKDLFPVNTTYFFAF